MSHDTKEWCKIWRKCFCFKNDKNLVNFDPSTKTSKKICTLIGPFCAKYTTTFDLKKVQRSYFMTLKSHGKFKKNVWKMT